MAEIGSNSFTYRDHNDDPEPDRCPHCHGYHSGGCHRAPAAPAPQAEVGEYYVGKLRVIIRRLGNELHECTACGVTLAGSEMRNHVLSHGAAPAETAGEMTAEQLRHTRSCPALTPGSDEYCTCGLRWRIALQTEQEMHAAWRKRAEESEAAEAFAKQRMEQAVDAAELRCEKLYNHEQECRIEGLRAKVADLERDNEIAKKEDWRRLAESNQATATEALALVEKQRTELREMREALTALVNKLHAVHDDQRYASVFIFYGNHGHKYEGPQYADELAAAERLLARKAE